MSTNPLKRFTLAELAEGDGKEGRPALVGYKGKVYDCTPSKLWKNGKHVNAHFAGQDLTDHMDAAPHMEDVMERYPVVGEIIEHIPLHINESPPMVAAVLARHPHPVTVHFPIGLGFIGTLFVATALVLELLGRPGQLYLDLRTASWYMLLVASLMNIPATATGLLSWWYNYGGALTPVYRWKIIFSVFLVMLFIAVVAIGWPGGQYLIAGSLRYWAYTLCVLAIGPTVILLGWLGGKIVYP